MLVNKELTIVNKMTYDAVYSATQVLLKTD